MIQHQRRRNFDGSPVPWHATRRWDREASDLKGVAPAARRRSSRRHVHGRQVARLDREYEKNAGRDVVLRAVQRRASRTRSRTAPRTASRRTRAYTRRCRMALRRSPKLGERKPRPVLGPPGPAPCCVCVAHQNHKYSENLTTPNLSGADARAAPAPWPSVKTMKSANAFKDGCPASLTSDRRNDRPLHRTQTTTRFVLNGSKGPLDSVYFSTWSTTLRKCCTRKKRHTPT